MKKTINFIFYLFYEMATFLRGNDPFYSAKIYYTNLINNIFVYPILGLISFKISIKIGLFIYLPIAFIFYFLTLKYHTKKMFKKEVVNSLIFKNRIKNKYIRIIAIIITFLFGWIIPVTFPFLIIIFINKIFK